MKKRLVAALAAAGAMTACVIYALTGDIRPPVVNILGAYAAVALILLILYRFPYRLYLLTLVFAFFAAGLGSVVNLYRTIGYYDRIIHFMSGVLLAEAGRLLAVSLLEKNGGKPLASVTLLFAVVFSFAAAGFWEIYEFTMDQLAGTNMQGNNLNTMGDIVCGFLGGLVYGGVACAVRLSQRRKKRSIRAGI